MSASVGSETSPTKVIQWILDTRPLWPEAAQTAQLKTYASRQLALLSSSEQSDVLRYVHVRDAKMALASRLLKRYVITRYAGQPSGTDISWWDAVATRNKDTKPVFYLPSSSSSSSSGGGGGEEPLVFNVTHQAGLVVLAAALSAPPGVNVGVDIVCPTERRARDHETVRRSGWAGFVAIHDEVFSPEDVKALEALPFGSTNTPAVLDRKLRYFYTVWCLREAYVKMTGEALLAPWLKVLEMRHFAPPGDVPAEAPGALDATGSSKTLEIWFEGRKREDVDMELVEVFGGEYIVGTCVGRNAAGEGLTLGAYEFLDIEAVTAFGEGAVAAGD